MNKPLNPPTALEAKELRKALGLPLRTMIASAPEGLDAMAIAELARAAAPRPVIHVARSGERMAALAEAVAFFAPDVELIEFPAWDCLPYDRVSPAPAVIARRMSALARLASGPA
jgi:transcription-repair coupling factor (superfamily II helicase)